MLIKDLKDNLKKAMLEEIKFRKSSEVPSDECVAIKDSCRAIISMFPETGKKPVDIIDDDIIKLCKKYIKTEKIRLLYVLKFITPEDVVDVTSSELDKLVKAKIISHDKELTSLNIQSIEKYLPKKVSEETVIEWIKSNIDFNQFKNKIQSMKPIMTHFKNSIDGNLVKKIIQNM